MMTMLSGCGGGGGDSAASTDSGGTSAITEAQEVARYMTSWYLWHDQAPKGSINGASSAEDALEALRFSPKDRYSYIEKASSQQAFFRDGTTIAFGFTYAIDGDTLLLRSVHELSPAGLAGLQRGDRIIAVDGVNVADLVANGSLSTAFGERVAGVTRELSIRKVTLNSSTVLVKLTKAEFAMNHVPVKKTVTLSNGTTAHYLVLDSFTEKTMDQWLLALGSIGAADSTPLIVDLRNNGGGLVASAKSVASTMAPINAENKLFTKLTYNSFHEAASLEFRFAGHERIAQPNKIVFLVSNSTCSSSEALIQGMKPFVSTTLIGSTTCGKPVGFTPQTIAKGQKILNAVDFSISNANNESDYFAGLTPTCSVTDDASIALGEPNEALLGSAMHWLVTGSCQVAATQSNYSGKSVRLPSNKIRSSADYFGIF